MDKIKKLQDKPQKQQIFSCRLPFKTALAVVATSPVSKPKTELREFISGEVVTFFNNFSEFFCTSCRFLEQLVKVISGEAVPRKGQLHKNLASLIFFSGTVHQRKR